MLTVTITDNNTGKTESKECDYVSTNTPKNSTNTMLILWMNGQEEFIAAYSLQSFNTKIQ